VVGLAGIADLAGSAHVLDIAVDPAWQGRGVGRALLARLLAVADQWGVDGVTLEVRSGDGRARRMYGRAGFVESGTRPGYYPDGDDAVIAWRR
ncbi:MAG: GNAT family N-acetyltransferase, partial [Nitriliruptoraceae bacterium]